MFGANNHLGFRRASLPACDMSPFTQTAASQAPPLHYVERGSGGEVFGQHQSMEYK